MMSKQRTILAVTGLLAVAGGWYAFRPERLFVNQRVSESFPVASATAGMTSTEPVALEEGRFRGVAHEATGKATIYRLPDGRRVLRLTEFMTSNGPDTRLYLVAAPDAADNATVTAAGFVDLGPVKGNIGDQNYDVPTDLDLERYRAVTVWCRRFSVNFATAPLGAAS